MNLNLNNIFKEVCRGDYILIFENSKEILYKIEVIEKNSDNLHYGTLVINKVGDRDNFKEISIYDKRIENLKIIKFLKTNKLSIDSEVKDYLILAFEEKFGVLLADTGDFTGILRGLEYY